MSGCNATIPEPCQHMCIVGADTEEFCLAERGEDWTNAGYADKADWTDACLTWAWEQRVLEKEAREEGNIEEVCVDRTAVFEEGDCDEVAAIDWNAPASD